MPLGAGDERNRNVFNSRQPKRKIFFSERGQYEKAEKQISL